MEDTSSSSSCSDSDVFPIPSDYELVEFVGDGDYGIVAKCKHRDTGETVAIKVSRYGDAVAHEASILQDLMGQNLDQCNIVKFYDWYQINNTTGLVLELLGINLFDYMTEHSEDRLPLKDIRFIIQQLATALRALRSAGVIHSDLKPDNIMLVKDEEQLITVKLIDFGLAFRTCEAVVGACYQVAYYRAPEIMLGLPFTEAIDMWSLGVVMGQMMFGSLIFPWHSEYGQMKTICEILGQPADHLLDAGLKTKEFFIKNSCNQWTIMSHDQYWNKISIGNKMYPVGSLDDLKMLSEEIVNDAEAKEWTQCIELLKAMLRVDANERITPSEVLNHLFITQSYINETLQPAASEPGTSQARTDLMRTETATEADDSIQDTQSDGNTALARLNDMLSIENLMLDTEPAAAPGTTQDADATKGIQTVTTELDNTTLDDSERHERKKKNSFRRFLWMKRTFSCCCSVRVEE
ncbi:homeodomain-interacting protein kinase 1-like isoform X1 [Thunnus albacares]|uniref:homeodomain-interacting protein kinase 1-like isoform X1 n=2 Tax=Thunnus albacares TaxID=8236 RepID=UPI001CF6D852|nr:homeodomain-interacting protein kinase 1-like isoform X1 [Thunnus albacares]XP_044199466.1 homeodomain-interacting protein kinase 1-like isoform X1 [Thunnus albacares]